MAELTHDQLREFLSYDPDTGWFTWLKRQGPARPGDRAGRSKPNKSGYLEVGLCGKLYGAHRLAWLYMTGSWPEGDVDHRDLDKTNNRWSNLREATRSKNKANVGRSVRNTSGVKGVTWHPKNQKWVAQLHSFGKNMYLGSFENIEDAAEAYKAAAQKYFGEFARCD